MYIHISYIYRQYKYIPNTYMNRWSSCQKISKYKYVEIGSSCWKIHISNPLYNSPFLSRDPSVHFLWRKKWYFVRVPLDSPWSKFHKKSKDIHSKSEQKVTHPAKADGASSQQFRKGFAMFRETEVPKVIFSFQKVGPNWFMNGVITSAF